MIYPNVEAVLASVLRAFDEVLLPALRRHLDAAAPAAVPEEKRVLSNAYTISHLIRLSSKRVAAQGQDYYDEIRLLEPLLRDIAALARTTGQPTDQAAADALEATAGAEWLAAGRYPSLDLTAERTNALRLGVQSGLAWLQAGAERLARTEAYGSLRARIRDYIGEQLSREATLVDASFRGFGLRR